MALSNALTDPIGDVAHGGAEAYSTKVPQYFDGVRRDYIAALPHNPRARILEIGCGDGGTGSLALSEGKCGYYAAVEIFPEAAAKASNRINEVVVGNVEQLKLPWQPDTFDALIMSEVLEHLIDPWATLRKLHPLLKPGALVFASSPNVSHRRVVSMLIRGEWTLENAGIMDRTHLRWFTPKTYRELFESSGYCVDSTKEATPLTKKARVFMYFTFGRFRHLFMTQVDLRARRG
jgi:2-polyprenyl-3-methyl-5-hydroxy-6-metoxy-1,4-benzoquinol methylase